MRGLLARLAQLALPGSLMPLSHYVAFVRVENKETQPIERNTEEKRETETD